MQRLDEIEVFCPSCLCKTRSSSESFQCINEGIMCCPLPYQFKLFENKEEAKLNYRNIDSWLPKYYFQPRIPGTANKNEKYWCVAYRTIKTVPIDITTISDIFRPQLLTLLESGLGSETKTPALIMDCTGNRLEIVDDSQSAIGQKNLPRNLTEYCTFVRKTCFGNCDGDNICKSFDEAIVATIKERKKPENTIWQHEMFFEGISMQMYGYICWAGKLEFVAPVIINNQLLAVIFLGQKVPKGKNGDAFLSKGLQTVEERLGLNYTDLANKLSSDEKAGHSVDIEPNAIKGNKYFLRLAELSREIASLANTTYIVKRQEREDYFLREIRHILTKENVTETAIHKCLKRLKEYFQVEEAYFCINEINKFDIFQIHAKATNPLLSDHEKDIRFSIELEDIGLREQVSIINLGLSEYTQDTLKEVQSKIPHLQTNTVLMGSCSLTGSSNAFWLIINPRSNSKSDTLTPLDMRFLTAFCITTHNVIYKKYASSVVMRNIGHELGASIQAIMPKLRAIYDGKCADIQLEVLKAIAQLEKYYCIVENLRSLFIRGSRDSYLFKNVNIASIILKIWEICLYDDEVERRKIDLPEPVAETCTVELCDVAIKVALFNLIQNAIKYSFDGHFVAVCGKSYDTITGRKMYRITINNFGVGITKEEIENRWIFMEEYRGILSKDRNRTGSGLGLAIVNRIVENHRGFIDVKSFPADKIHSSKEPVSMQSISVFLRSYPNYKELKNGFLNIFTMDLPITQEN